mgnify:CR=1 FL=1
MLRRKSSLTKDEKLQRLIHKNDFHFSRQDILKLKFAGEYTILQGLKTKFDNMVFCRKVLVIQRWYRGLLTRKKIVPILKKRAWAISLLRLKFLDSVRKWLRAFHLKKEKNRAAIVI